MSNFDPNSVNNLVGLWDFIAGNETADTGLDDGIAQNGHFEGNAFASGDRAHFDGHGDHFDVSGDDDAFDLSKGTVEVQFTQDAHVGSSPDTLVSRGEFDDDDDEGYFSISITLDGRIKVIHTDGSNSVTLTTAAGIASPGDNVNVKYSFDASTGVQLVVENNTTGATETVANGTTGLTLGVGDDDDENFTFGAREVDDGDYDRYFDGKIDYVAIYESAVPDPQPDGAVDGEAFGEVMELGYDDSNAPTDQGGDIITNDADLIFGNGGDDTIDGAQGDDTIYGDSGPGGTTREIFKWSEGPGFANNADTPNFIQNTGSAKISFSTVAASAGVESQYETSQQNTDDLDAAVGEQSSFESSLDDDSQSATYSWESDQPIENVEFRINDIDGDGVVTVRAFDENGNPVEVTLSDAGTGLSLSNTDGVAGNDTATSIDDNYTNDSNAEHSVLVTIAGPVSSFEIIHTMTGDNDSGINVTDIAFDAAGGPFGDPGDDVIDGNDGDDVIFGEEGDDTITGGDGSDSIDAGNGDNVVDASGSSPLPDLGFPAYGLFPAVPADGDPNDDRDYVKTGQGNDDITTGDDADTIEAGGGNDTIDSGIDDDVVNAGSGDDLVITGEGNDFVEGFAGNDTIYGGLGPSVPQSINIPDAPDSGAFGPDPEENNGKDTIDGGRGNDVIFGEDDDDLIFGGIGADTLDGGIDDDTIFGGTGKDDLTGGQGADSLDGGEGNDEFFIDDREDAFGDTVIGGNGPDETTDFDRLDLTGLGKFQIRDADGNLADDENDPDLIDPTDDGALRGTVEFLDANGVVEGTLEFSQIEKLIICFTPGVAIATPSGEMAVEDLKAGDRVITRDDGVQEIRWIGATRVSALGLQADPALRPVMIRKGALGNGLPERDMMVSPNHRMLMANEHTHVLFDEREVLIAAKHLVGQPGIERVEVPGTEYIHLMFDRHEVILGDGAWTESFHPGDYSLKGIDHEQREEIYKLFPELMEAKGLKNYGAARHSLKAYEAKMLREGLVL